MFGSKIAIHTKWDRGRVVIMGGSTGTAFAIHHACIGAMRSGAGLTVAMVPKTVVLALDYQATYKIVSYDGYHSVVPESLWHILKASNALVAGIGIEEDTNVIKEFFSRILNEFPNPMIIDADLSLSIGNDPSILIHRKVRNVCLLVLNVRETETVFGTKRPSKKLVTLFCKEFDIYVLIKGKVALLFSSDGIIHSVENRGFPEIAVAGSGDLLSGIIGGLLAQRLDIVTSVSTALELRSVATKIYLKKTGDIVAHPHDVAQCLPYAWQQIKRRTK
ncbi:MAG: NAD(P)H-hydrate dehydratase [bacterium]|nr:NAD(P)H-hydrate dehydratase [bacterium]